MGTVCLVTGWIEKRRKTNQNLPQRIFRVASCSQGDAGSQDQLMVSSSAVTTLIWSAGMDESRRTCWGTPLPHVLMEHQMWCGAALSCNQMWEFAQIANFAGDNLAFRWEFEELRPEGEKGQTCHKTDVFSHRGGVEGTCWPHSRKYKCSLKGPRSRLMTGINVGSQKEAGIWASVRAAPPEPHSPSTDSRLRWLSASLSVLGLQQRDKIGLSRAVEC